MSIKAQIAASLAASGFRKGAAATVTAAAVAGGALYTAGEGSTASPPGPGWELTKAYEFDSASELDEFGTRYVWPREQVINNESQAYLDPDAAPWSPFDVSDGVLTITAKLTPDELKPFAHGQPYVSGVLTTRDEGWSQQYGFWEARMKLPAAGGAWPAFWTLPTHASWPAGIAVLDEQDIMEAVADVGEGVYHGSMHTNQSGRLESTSQRFETALNLTDEFHVYGMGWNETEITWYFNGTEMARQPTPDDMRHPRHLLLNLAVGGWGGTPVAADYPATFEIDWVRVWKRADAAVPKSVPPVVGSGEGETEVLFVLADGRPFTKGHLRQLINHLAATGAL